MTKKKKKERSKSASIQGGFSIKSIIVIVLIILIIGLIFATFSKSKKEKESEIICRKQRLVEIKERIRLLKPRREQLERTERRYFLWARVVIAIILLISNALYLHYSAWNFVLGDQLNFNGAILLVYSFVAFIGFGTPNALVSAIKEAVAKELRKNHIDILTELEQLEKEEIEIEEFLKTEEI